MISLTGLTGTFNFIKEKFKEKTYKAAAAVIIAAIAFNLLTVLYFMVTYHPYQNLYFNRMAGKIWKK